MASAEMKLNIAFNEEALKTMSLLKERLDVYKERERELFKRLEAQELRVVKIENQLKELGKL